LLEAILNECESECIEKWKATEGVLERENVWYELKAIEGLREHLATTIANIIAGDGDSERTDTAGGDAGAGAKV